MTINSKFFRQKVLKKKITKKRTFVKPSNRKLAIALDEYKCKDCGAPINLNNSGDGAHHIIFKSEYIDDSLENLITLCFSCHRFAHDGYRKDGHKLSARDYIIELLKDLQNMPNFRWGRSLELLKKKANI